MGYQCLWKGINFLEVKRLASISLSAGGGFFVNSTKGGRDEK
jgi:hypothetical protein